MKESIHERAARVLHPALYALFAPAPSGRVSLGLEYGDVDRLGTTAGRTTWDPEMKIWKIFIHPSLRDAPDEWFEAVLLHELFHVVQGHLQAGECPKGRCRVIAQEVQVNYHLRDRLDDLAAAIRRSFPEEELKALEAQGASVGPVDPTEIMSQLEIDWPQWEAVEEVLHQKMDALPDRPSCVDPTNDPEATRQAKIAGLTAGSAMAQAGGQGQSTGWGDSPGVAAYLAKAAPVPPWLKTLRRFLSDQAGKALSPCMDDDITEPVDNLWRASRAWIPDLNYTFEPRGVLTLLVDMSGSMPYEILDRVAAAVNAIASAGMPVRLIAGDVDVAFDETVRKFPRRITGVGGGTDIVPLFEKAKGSRAIVCVTDTEIPCWPEDPGVPVLWIIPSNGAEPPFGKVVTWN